METSKSKKKHQSFKSLEELEAAKKEIKKEYSKLESNAIANYFDPMKMAVDFAPSVLRLFKKSKNTKNGVGVSATLLRKDKDLNSNLKSAPKKAGIFSSINIVTPSKSKGLGNKVVSSLIRWQLFELGLWGVKKLISSQKKSVK